MTTDKVLVFRESGMNILQTILEGALGGLTFGIYHHYVTMREIKKFNEKMNKKFNLK